MYCTVRGLIAMILHENYCRNKDTLEGRCVGFSLGVHQIFGKITVPACSAKFLVNIGRKRIVKSPLDIFQKL